MKSKCNKFQPLTYLILSKKLILVLTFLSTIVLFAQKDELKTLKKIYAKDTPSKSDFEAYNTALSSLEKLSLTEDDKIYKNFYEGMKPFLEMALLGDKITPQDQFKIFTPNVLAKFSSAVTVTLAYEKNSGKKIYTDDINEVLSYFMPMLESVAFELNTAKQYKQSAIAFYYLYQLNKEEGANLLNAAILANQSEDYKLALQYYEEYNESDYLKNGFIYYATNAITDKEESFTSKKSRQSKLDFKTHIKPRNEKVKGKEDIFTIIAYLKSKLGDVEGAKKAYTAAKALNPDKIEILISESEFYNSIGETEIYKSLLKELVTKDPNNALAYYYLGVAELKDDNILVEEINKNLDNVERYNTLTKKRNEMYKLALPNFEKAYNLEPTNENYKQILKETYLLIGMKEQAEKF